MTRLRKSEIERQIAECGRRASEYDLLSVDQRRSPEMRSRYYRMAESYRQQQLMHLALLPPTQRMSAEEAQS